MNRVLVAILTVATLTIPARAAERVTIALNWVPEPEFGGIYAAKQDGAYKDANLDVVIQSGGAGAPTWQLVANGKAEFAVASADEVIIARGKKADVVAIFTIYQTCPQGIMTHAARGLKSIADVFNTPGTLAMEVGLPYGKFLQQKYGFDKIKRVSYDGGIGNFLADKNFSQQCFVFSEPLAAKKAGADPQTFLIADAGYNPYTGVIITTGDMIKSHGDIVAAMTGALVKGWADYQKDPKPANEAMQKLNRSMDAATFAAAAEAQKPLVESDDTKQHRLGWMTAHRWQELCKQLTDLKVVAKAPAAEECFVNPQTK